MLYAEDLSMHHYVGFHKSGHNLLMVKNEYGLGHISLLPSWEKMKKSAIFCAQMINFCRLGHIFVPITIET